VNDAYRTFFRLGRTAAGKFEVDAPRSAAGAGEPLSPPA
jgi:hypothetical protein